MVMPQQVNAPTPVTQTDANGTSSDSSDSNNGQQAQTQSSSEQDDTSSSGEIDFHDWDSISAGFYDVDTIGYNDQMHHRNGFVHDIHGDVRNADGSIHRTWASLSTDLRTIDHLIDGNVRLFHESIPFRTHQQHLEAYERAHQRRMDDRLIEYLRGAYRWPSEFEYPPNSDPDNVGFAPMRFTGVWETLLASPEPSTS
ncbi:uncharacterized protein EHS24_004734 [Apiotrichum porosum]|uniref:Uncharacterized protein n=1 Tax=Apiotrichum porosum TaxID=105984 RepID=A0A427Y5X2_9TREE|nr:uncharacterized protein EHS24_004734 [Apiotrichum porosum]RSH86478.1 hypothetical protein EHS24_004734 [Apiotrichum porosum]